MAGWRSEDGEDGRVGTEEVLAGRMGGAEGRSRFSSWLG